MYFIVTLGVGVGAVGQPKLGTLGLNWVYTAVLHGRYSKQVSLQMILFLREFVNNPESCFGVP